MSRKTLETWMPSNLAELRDAVNEIAFWAADELGSRVDAETVYVDVRSFTLVRETLTDGSVVLKLRVRENSNG